MSTPVLELHEIKKYYGALRAVDGVSLQVAPREIHALIGPNGAGKSTLVDIIYGSVSADAGAIYFLREQIATLSVPARANLGIGRSFQISNVFNAFTVLENAIIAEQARLKQGFRFVLPAFSDPDLRRGGLEILSRVGIADIAHRRVADIAHGERRLLELALTLPLSPKLLVLDEPMAGTSAVESKRMTALIAELAQDSAVLLIEHDMDAVFALADRLSVLVEGKIIAQDTPEVIRADSGVRSAYLGEMDY